MTTYYIAAIHTDGLVTYTSIYGGLDDATSVLNSWVERGQNGGKQIVFATIANTETMLFRYSFDVPGLPPVTEV